MYPYGARKAGGPVGPPMPPGMQWMAPPGMYPPAPGPQYGAPPPPQQPPQQQRNGFFTRAGPGEKRPAGGLESYDTIMSAPPLHLRDQGPNHQPTRQQRPNRHATLPVSVGCPNKKTVNMFLAVDDTLEDVYTTFERAAYVYNADDIRLSFNGQELVDGPTPIKEAGLDDGAHMTAVLKHRSGWGIVGANAPTPAPPAVAEQDGEHEGRPFGKEETEEWRALQPGQSRTMLGYDESMAAATSRKGRILMSIYDESMSRPAPGATADMRNVTACRHWAQYGKCKYMDRCHYSHAGRPKTRGLFFQRPDPRQSVACTFHAKGRCLRGEACPFSHDAPVPGTRATFGGGQGR
eukprot:TRINITY_DN1511_c0_g2_i1.p2 TRINITY_DN1511_c0_g2~~TRINITY_DN1511_c0_g2_i1.p2  ORF type:complete len:349 (+),score=74.84 TRINITY_DN1511_c0_g2_i1:57-1103(+)